MKRVFVVAIVAAVACAAILAVALVILTPPGAMPPGAPPVPAAGEGILAGNVLLGPTCPVERVPPLPGCAPRPYPTTILVYGASDGATPVATFATDASGTFSIALPAGSYVVQAKGGSANNAYYPRCGGAAVMITAGAAATTTLSCDTGIR